MSTANSKLQPTQFGAVKGGGAAAFGGGSGKTQPTANFGSFSAPNNSSSPAGNTVYRNPYTGQILQSSNQQPISNQPFANSNTNNKHLDKTNFGPNPANFKPVNPNLDLGKELQTKYTQGPQQVKGSYGNYGQAQNPFLRGLNDPAVNQNPKQVPVQSHFHSNLQSSKTLSSLDLNSSNSTNGFKNSTSINSNQIPTQINASNYNNQQSYNQQNQQSIYTNYSNQQNIPNPVSRPMGANANANANVYSQGPIPGTIPGNLPSNLAPSTQANNPNSNQNSSGGFFSRFLGNNQNKQDSKNQIPTTKKVDTTSLEYLRSLSPADLRKEIIKTEIEIQKALLESEKAYREGVSTIRDLIAPSAVKITSKYLELGTKLLRTFFVLVYPRVITMGWLEGLVNADIPLDISIYIEPRDSSEVLRELRGKVGKIQASLQLNAEQGKARDPQLETAYRDVEGLRDAIQQGVEKFFRVGVYITIYADNEDMLEKNSQTVEGILSQQNIIIKRAALQMDDGFNSCLPILKDDLNVLNNMNTSPLSACFPFVSSDLSSDNGILYGINRHNSSLIIFDRFELENANSVVFATSGAGKSYTVKLEILRSLMLGVSVIVIDPEQEYKILADTLGGTYINLSLNSPNRINPFDLPKALQGESNADILRTAIIDLMGLMNLMLGKLNPTEVSIMERAIQECYSKRDITPESDFSKITPPTMTDLVEILEGIVGGESLAQRLYRYTEGTFAGIFNKPTNVNLNNDFIVFNIRDLQEQLRPIAMYILLKYIWTEIRASLKKRILAIDEAWILMQYEDSARFLYGLAKRARKYYLGITTITQDVGDFLNSPLGKPIVTNAAMKILLKQSTAAIDKVGETFALTSGEKQVLLQSEVGQGIFFAGPRHVAMEVVAFPTEHRIITTNPKDILRMQGLEE